MSIKVNGTGPKTARIMIVGEAPGEDEEIKGQPFVGASGMELTRMLREAGIRREECYITNSCKFRPPGNDMEKWLTAKKTVGTKQGWNLRNGRWMHPHIEEGLAELQEEIASVSPELIIGLGNTALWALTGNWGITNWRGSQMELDGGIRFVPTLHPASILRAWQMRPYAMKDLRFRASKWMQDGYPKPDFDFNTAPTLDEVIAYLRSIPDGADMAGDIETCAGHIVCLGIADSALRAMCIPFRNIDGVYWGRDEWQEVVNEIRATTARVNWIGQNWSYDAQYFGEDFGFEPMAGFDTLVAQSVLYPGVPRKLGFLSSMYCEWHEFWKEDREDWGKIADFPRLFRYNCRDAVATWEVAQVLRGLLAKERLMPQFDSRMEYSYRVYNMMRRGINRDDTRTKAIDEEVSEALQEREIFVKEQAGHEVNFDSPKQVANLFYNELGCKAIKKRGSTSVTTNDEALKTVMEKYPHIAPVALAILESRSLRSIRSNFLRAQLDPDRKFRSSWNPVGTETFRLTSSKNAFYRGGPLQNVTDGKHTHSGRRLPNLRSCIVPDEGCIIYNCDLERADLQVVVWEANDEDLKQKLREHVDIHAENAKDVFGLSRAPTEQERHFGKQFVHGTDYGGKARTMAAHAGCTVHEADLAQRRWFAAHPGILDWHKRVMAYLVGTRTVTNRFGYRRIYFERVESLLPEALAWIPQSTVSILISLIQMAIEDALADLQETLMQGHDSVAGQYRKEDEEIVLSRMHAASKIAIPYEDPLYIPLELATSESSWGEVQKREWPV